MKRTKKESFADYKVRRFKWQTIIKNYLKGRLIYKTNNPNNAVGLPWNVPYVNQQSKPETTSYTEQLRNANGYDKKLIGIFKA
jgi:hypothetical protein